MSAASSESKKNGEDELQTALSDLSSLGRVSHRLAMVDTSSKLQSVLDKLLARLLERIGTNHQKQAAASGGNNNQALTDTLAKIHQKLVETLSHAMKRVRDDRQVKLNCGSILKLLLIVEEEDGNIPKANPLVNPFTLNLSLAFLAIGVPRCSETELKLILPDLIILHGFYAARAVATTSTTVRSHWHQISHLLIKALELIITEYHQEQGNAAKKPKLSNSTASATPSQILSASNGTPVSNNPTVSSNGSMDDILEVLDNDSIAQSALYDLLLDMLLYQSTTGGVPPPGCSQAGQERLQSNKAWTSEMAPPARLSLCKTRLLDWVAPSRQTCLFPTNQARSCTLLLAACGDGGSQVSSEAGMYLKQYLDSQQERSSNAANAENLLDLVMEMLILCVGANNALLALAGSALPTLGLDHSESAQAAAMPFRRRMVSDATYAVMMTHVDKIFSNEPRLFEPTQNSERIKHVGTLSILAISKMLVKLRTSTGLTAIRGKPYVSAAKAMNSLVIRFLSVIEGADEDQKFEEDILKHIEPLLAKALALTCTSLSNTVIGSSPSSSSAVTSNEGNISVRDALYGVVCALSRSATLVSNPHSWLFTMGQEQTDHQTSINVDTASLLFSCLSKEEQSVLPRATAALDALLTAYCRIARKQRQTQSYVEAKEAAPMHNPWGALPSPDEVRADESPRTDPLLLGRLAKSLLPLLWRASQNIQSKPSRLAVARWSSELLKRLDLNNACHLLCFLSGDKDVTVVSIAKRGLGAEDDNTQAKQQKVGEKDGNETDDEGEDSIKLADFTSLNRLLFVSSQGKPSFWEFQPKAKAAAIAYLLKCLLNDFYGGDDEAVFCYLDAVTKSIKDVESLGRSYSELLDECAASLSACLSTSLFARRLVFGAEVRSLSLTLKDLEKLALSVSSSYARRALADSCGSMYGDTSLWGDAQWLSSIVGMMSTCLKALEPSNNGHQGGSVHGAAFLGGTCVKQYRLNQKLATSEDGWHVACRILTFLGNGTTVADEIVGKAFTGALSVALSHDAGGSGDSPQLDARLLEGATSALSGLANALRKYSSDENVDVSRTSKVAHSIGVCLEATILFSGGAKKENDLLHSVRLNCVDNLLSLLGSSAYRKDEGIALEAGEALAAYAWVPKGLEWESSSGSDAWPDEFDADFAKSLPPHQQVVYTVLRGSKLTSNPLKRTAHAPVLLALVARAASRVNHDPSNSSTGLVKEVSRRLVEVQSSFISILADPKSKHLCRESCCLGLAACRSLAKLSDTGDEVNEKLLRAFGETTNFGTSAMQETQDQANRRRREEGRSNDAIDDVGVEAEVGGNAGMSEAALGAYREMAAAAVSLGRPDVLYSLFMLSVTHPAWFSKDGRERYGPSALLGENSIIGSRANAAELRLALRPHLSKIIPRLLRASHDPNKHTREQIRNLWDGLTGGGAEARLAITQHLLPIIDSLVADTSHKLWRARVGATGALAQVIVGRSWQDLGGGPPVLDDDDILSNAPTTKAGIRLLKLWNISMRSLDDVRGAVRESGETLARGVRSLTMRLCDPVAAGDSQKAPLEKKAHFKDSSAAAATSLRWLIRFGLNQPCPEATGVCVSCLVGVITVVKPAILQPLIPDLLRSLLLAMSSLEPAALSYLQVRAAGQGTDADSSYGSLERLRLQVAQAGPLAEAVTKMLDILPEVDFEVQRAVIPQLNSALRQSAGFTTRAAVADACSTLCSSCPNAFKFTGPTSTNPSVGLLRGFFHGAEREAGATARSKMAHAFGNLAALCPGSSVRALALRACNNYNSATGANHDPAVRLAAAFALRSIAVRAQNQFSDGGNGDVWCRRVLPVAFLGTRDTDSKIAQLWKEVWEEGGSAANLAGTTDCFGNALEEKLLFYIVKECEKALADVSWSRRASGAEALKELGNIRILAPLPSQKNAEKIDQQFYERSKRRSLSSQLALNSLVQLLSAARLWSGKSEVARAAGQIAGNWSQHSTFDFLEKFTPEDKLDLTQPVSLHCQGQEDDLFVGDGWHHKEHQDEPEDEDGEVEKSITPSQDDYVGTDVAEIGDADALVAETTTENALSMPSVSFVGLCRMLLIQAFPTPSALMAVAEEEVLPYRAIALQSLTNLLNALDDSAEGNALKRLFFDADSLNPFSVFNSLTVTEVGSKEPPLFIARSLDCFAACFWVGAGTANDALEILGLVKNLFKCLEHAAWTVRESAALCCSCIVSKGHSEGLVQYETISLLISCVSKAAKDRKFWRVRFSGIKLLHAIVARVGHSAADSTVSPKELDDADRQRQELLESVLPHKEKILQLAKQSLSDSEAKVTALATDVVKAIAWWP